jgi:hypothetical protein
MSENEPAEGRQPETANQAPSPIQVAGPPPKDLQNAIRKLSETRPQAMTEIMSIVAGGMGNPLQVNRWGSALYT